MIFPHNFEHIVGFDILRESLVEGCDTTAGKNQLKTKSISTNKQGIEYEWDMLSEWQTIQQTRAYDFGNFAAFDFLDFVGKLDLDGNYLDEVELFILWQSVEYFEKTQKFFKSVEKYPNLSNLFKAELDLNEIPKAVKSILDKDAQLLPYASAEYGKINKDIKQLTTEIRSICLSIYAKWKKAGYTAETEITVREDKMVIPVIAEYKRKVGGFVNDISATGKVLYIEPSETVELNNLLKERTIELRMERIKILKKITAIVRPFRDELKDLIKIFTVLDVCQSKYRLCALIQAERPSLGQKLELVNSRNPLLWWNKPNDRKTVVPFTLKLDNKQRVILISGPNAGGKTVVLKTTLLCAYMAQFGLFIPADAESIVPIFSHFFIECGDGQNIESGLSTFSAHLKALNTIVEKSNEKSLLGIDEIASGTDPVFAIPIGRAVLETLLKNGALGIATTHFGKLKQWAHQNEEITNAGMEYDTQKLEPMFRLKMQVPGNSYAPELMKKSKFHFATQKRALALINTKDFKEERLIADLESKEQEWNKLLADSNKKQGELNNLLEQYNDLKAELNSQKEKIIIQAEKEAKRIVSQINKSLETTIKNIKETKADKAATLEKRRGLEKTIAAEVKKIETIKESTQRKPEEKELNIPQAQQVITWQEGSVVKNMGNDMLGEIVEIKKDKALVAFGIIKIWVRLDQLQASEGQKIKPGGKPRLQLMQRQEAFKTELNLIGGTGQESVQIAEKWLDEAYAMGKRHIKIIHGHGTGTLRKMIRDMLRTKGFIKKYGPEEPNNGGNGATVIELM